MGYGQCPRCGGYGFGCYECTPPDETESERERVAGIIDTYAECGPGRACAAATAILSDREAREAETLSALRAELEEARAFAKFAAGVQDNVSPVITGELRARARAFLDRGR